MYPDAYIAVVSSGVHPEKVKASCILGSKAYNTVLNSFADGAMTADERYVDASQISCLFSSKWS